MAIGSVQARLERCVFHALSVVYANGTGSRGPSAAVLADGLRVAPENMLPPPLLLSDNDLSARTSYGASSPSPISTDKPSEAKPDKTPGQKPFSNIRAILNAPYGLTSSSYDGP